MARTINVYNMPENMLYEFANNRYVWQVKLPETRNGNYKQNNYVTFTEVYEKQNNLFQKIASGRLVNNPYTIKEGEFSIFDYDQDLEYSFKEEKPLTRASLDDMYLLRDCIKHMYNGKNK